MKFIFRRMIRQKLYTLVNLSGLSIGFACFILIMVFINSELSYDRFYENSDRIYRVTSRYNLSETYQLHFARCHDEYLVTLPDEYPEIEAIARFHHAKSVVNVNNNKYTEDRFYIVDPELHEVFDYDYLEGNPEYAFEKPYSLVITETTRMKYFGETDALGKTVSVINHYRQNETQLFTVTGVIKDIPPESHFHFDFLGSLGSERKHLVNEWNYIYILLADGADGQELEAKLPELVAKNEGEERRGRHIFHLMPITDIHLHSHIDRELEKNAEEKYIYIFALIALITVSLAVINYINMSTSVSVYRLKETGIRKALGAGSRDLLKLHLYESVLINGAAFIIAIMLAALIMPYFNTLAGRLFQPGSLFHWKTIGLSAVIMAAAVAVSGFANALNRISVNPSSLIRDNMASAFFTRSGRSGFLRRLMVVAQFSVSILLIIFAGVIILQMRYMSTKDIGFKTENVIAIPDIPFPVRAQYETFKTNLMSHPEIHGITRVMHKPSQEVLDAGGIRTAGLQQDPENPLILYTLPVDVDFFETLDIAPLAGTTIKDKISNDSLYHYILNEEAVRQLGWESPEDAVGRIIEHRNDLAEGPVVGVVPDFNFSTLRKKIKALVMFKREIWLGCFLLKTVQDQRAALEIIQQQWESMFPQYPFEYRFLDDLYEGLYGEERRQARLIITFSIIAVLIACLGLFGLASFTAAKRMKEMAVRKVLGAHSAGIASLILIDYLKWVAAANLIAWPAAWYVSDMWLADFAYTTNISPMLYFAASLIVLIIALVTVVHHAGRTARVNPVEILKQE